MAAGIGSYEVKATSAVYYRQECCRWLELALAEKYEEGYPIDKLEQARCLAAAEDCAALAVGAEVLWGTARQANVVGQEVPQAWRVTGLPAG